LGHIISKDGVRVHPDTVAPVARWPIPRNSSELKSYLGLTNFFRKFVESYSVLVSPLTDLTSPSRAWVWTENTHFAFEYLKHRLTQAPILKLPNMDEPFTVVTDASIEGAGAVLLQGGHPVAYESKKFSPAERNYSTTEQEMAATHYALQKWRCYLEGPDFSLITDHKPNKYFATQPLLSRRQARWNEFFQRFHFKWEWKPGKTNIADPLSRMPPWLAFLGGSVRIPAPKLSRNARARLAVTLANRKRKVNDKLALSPLRRGRNPPPVVLVDKTSAALKGDTGLERSLHKGYTADPWFRVQRNHKLLHYDNGLYWLRKRPTAVVVPNVKEIKMRILREAHDSPYSGHGGLNRTMRTLIRYFWWPKMRQEVDDYIKTCHLCQRNKDLTVAPLGLLQPVDKPEVPWEQIGTDFITGLPKTTAGFDAILVFVDHATKMVHFCPTTEQCDAPEWAQLYVDNVYRLHGLSLRICSDRGTTFTSKFHIHLTQLNGTKLSLSTSFHPQSGGQHERMNRVLEEMLRHYVSADHSDWDKHLSMAEFAMNNAVNVSTGRTPFELNQGWHPRTPLGEEIHRQHNSQAPMATAFVANWQQRMREAKELIQVAQARMKQFVDKGKVEPVFKVGDKVMLSTKNIRLKRGNGVCKLLPRWIGPYEITQVVSVVAYRLELPLSLKIHPVFHVSLLKPFRSTPDRVQPPPPPLLLTDEDAEIYEVEAILGHRDRYRQQSARQKAQKAPRKISSTQFLIKWQGYGPDHNTWEPEKNVRPGSDELVREYWKAQCLKRK
jgi:RNase H-like domain found in reverse transcriptase/Integrase zinc binding domain/Chromo (CHRromatin Organisation MOdifier) domain